MNSFALCPLQQGYNPEIANNILEQALMGGFARQRIQFVNNTHTINASVMLDDKGKQEYFWAFWRSHQANPRPFLWQLIIDDFMAKTYECQFIAGSIRVNERNGIVYSVSFGIRVKPNNTGKEFDDEIIAAWNDGDPRTLFNLLAKLVNEDLPAAFGEL